ncbi:hypothetical protein BKA63DRAFT_581384 [Paraphoma chrysanthemicola]|nr:hypothetical protein BKA63DRAFT_581384 [Paraphoma chrysanthemicola]
MVSQPTALAHPLLVPTSSEATVINKWMTALRQPTTGISPPAPTIPSCFTLIAKAGSGINADAYFRLPTSDIKIARSTHSSSSPRDMVSNLQVVKTCRTLFQVQLPSEVSVLKAFQIQLYSHSDHSTLPLFHLTAWDAGNAQPSWYACSTLSLCTDLKALEGRFHSMPEEFVWLVYTQLQAAITFMHKTCDPPLAHGDLHLGNIIVGYSAPDDTGLPQVKVIDFGMAQYEYNADEYGEDLMCEDMFQRDMLFMLHALKNILYNTHYAGARFVASPHQPATWGTEVRELGDTVRAGVRGGSVSEEEALRRMWERFGEVAKGKVEGINDVAREKIRIVVWSVAGGKYDEIVEKVGELLGHESSNG